MFAEPVHCETILDHDVREWRSVYRARTEADSTRDGFEWSIVAFVVSFLHDAKVKGRFAEAVAHLLCRDVERAIQSVDNLELMTDEQLAARIFLQGIWPDANHVRTDWFVDHVCLLTARYVKQERTASRSERRRGVRSIVEEVVDRGSGSCPAPK